MVYINQTFKVWVQKCTSQVLVIWIKICQFPKNIPYKVWKFEIFYTYIMQEKCTISAPLQGD